MRVIKYFTKNGWKSLYSHEIAKALFADKNLDDVLNKEQARANLELNGENNHTHYHDDRYIPLIQQAEDRVTNLIENFKVEMREKDILSPFKGTILEMVNLKNGWYRWTGTLDSITATWIILKTDTLYTAVDMEDPRIVLRSNDLNNWYSAYAYWHA